MSNLLSFFGDIGDIFSNLFQSMGFMSETAYWGNYVMLAISFVLFYLAIVKKFEPLLLLPIAFGMMLINIPGAEAVVWGTYLPDKSLELGINGSVEYVGAYANGLTDAIIYIRAGYLNGDAVSYYASYDNLLNGVVSTMSANDFSSLYSLQGYIEGSVSNGVTAFVQDFSKVEYVLSHSYEDVTNRGLLWYLYYGVDKVIYPPLIFLGIGAMTDFGPLIADPKSMLIGAAAQLGVFLTFIGAAALGYFAGWFTLEEAAAIAMIGGADGPTAIYVAKKLAEVLLPAIAIAAYSYMALIPIIQKPIMRLLTTKQERAIKMTQLRTVSKTEKILFPIIVTVSGRHSSSRRYPSFGYAYARKPLQGVRSVRQTFQSGAERTDEYPYDIPRGRGRLQSQSVFVPVYSDSFDYSLRSYSFLLRHDRRYSYG